MNKRKQKIELKSEDLFSTEKDTLMDYDATSDWFSSSTNSDLDIPSNVFYDDFLNLLDMPLNLLVDESLSQENKEIFQDLCCTSTPKSSRPHVSKTLGDSGIAESLVKTIYREDESSHVLEDITNKVDSIKNIHFTEVKHLSTSKSFEACDLSFKKHVNILRKDFVLQTRSKNTNDSSCITKEQMIYYTGIKNYDIAIAILKHIKMPKCEVSSFKMELMALMKLRLDLPWLDMSFRFSIPETILKELVKKSIDVMSYSLEDLIPWHYQRKLCRRTLSRIYYVYSLASSESSHILIILSDYKRPFLFITENFNSDISALSVVLNKCSMHLIPGDILCITDATGINLFYTVKNPDLAYFLASPSPNHLSVIEKCQHLMTELLSDFVFLTKQNDTFDVSKLVKIASAIFNINVSGVSSIQLQKIFEKSSHIILNDK